MLYIDRQIQATRNMQKFIKLKDGGWFKIVRSPEEARRVIRSGKLAVVQGIEVDNLFNCKRNKEGKGACNVTGIRASVEKYYNKGVRHIFPIHNFDNAFGGPATC